jgi:hypothetical protein
MQRRRHGSPTSEGRPEYVKAACERSLQRLETDVIDLYYIHRVDPTVPIESMFDSLADFDHRNNVDEVPVQPHRLGRVRTRRVVPREDRRSDRSRRCAVFPSRALGRHRLLCGDSTVATGVGRVLGGVAPHLMVTDPPYGVSYDPAWRNRAAAQGIIEQKKGIACHRRGRE